MAGFFLRCFFIFIISYQPAYANELYWLCGPDEDGCPEDGYEYCACIPYNKTQAEARYCFDFNNLSCEPLSEHPDCEPYFIMPNQASCLGTIFHSMPDIPCTLSTYDFCKEKQTSFCAENGMPSSCQHLPG